MFAIQSEIGTAVVGALKIKLVGRHRWTEKPPSGNVEAYQWMLQGRAQARRGPSRFRARHRTAGERRCKLDPDYAYAWAVLANSGSPRQSSSAGDARQQAIAQARVRLEGATCWRPTRRYVHGGRGYLLAGVDHDQAGALEEFQRALALAPNDGNAMNFLAATLTTSGKPQQAADLFRKAIATDPLRADW